MKENRSLKCKIKEDTEDYLWDYLELDMGGNCTTSRARKSRVASLTYSDLKELRFSGMTVIPSYESPLDIVRFTDAPTCDIETGVLIIFVYLRGAIEVVSTDGHQDDDGVFWISTQVPLGMLGTIPEVPLALFKEIKRREQLEGIY